MKLRALILLFLLLGAAMAAEAAPLRHAAVTLVQPNGDTLRCFASGDEYFNYLHDADGYVIIRDKQTSYYVYAAASGDTLAASAWIPGRDNPQQHGLRPYTLGAPGKITETVRKQRQMLNAAPAGVKQYAAADSVRNRGQRNNIVVMIRFSDDADYANQDEMKRLFNDDSTSNISLKSYYKEVSYNLLTVDSHIYPVHHDSLYPYYSYQDSLPRAYYQRQQGEDDQYGYTNDAQRTEREFTLLQHAVDAVKDQIPADLNVDMDDDGSVDNIVFVLKGSPVGWSDILWPHAWRFYSNYTTTINGKTTDAFNVQLESDLKAGGATNLCHEFFHTLGAPDLYHYNAKDTMYHPVGAWDLMANNTSPPQHMSAYMKYRYGNWLDSIPTALGPDDTLRPLNSLTPEKVCYKLPSPLSPDEYYVLEYRKVHQAGTIESKIPGSGLVIYRINTKFDGQGNRDYDPDNAIFDEVYVFRPKGTLTNNGNLNAAFFSSDAKRTYFNHTSDPSCFLSDGKTDAVNIFFITSSTKDSLIFSTINLIERLDIIGDTILLGKVYQLAVEMSPPTAHGNIRWDADEVTGKVDIRSEGLILGSKSGFVWVRAYVEGNDNVSALKRIVIIDNKQSDPVIAYWAGYGANGLLTIENMFGISKIEVFNQHGRKSDEKNYPNETVISYDFTRFPRGMYFLRVWNVSKTQFVTLKVLW
ncbi:MAG: M6 family metalloprotease domain-containing protein [Prevotellaceae bacterium]|jgi:M6 family metalloprotease-like protein|nr:M6 family metalloprotease domain-containing protein [Prevotellaceae bacterium]